MLIRLLNYSTERKGVLATAQQRTEIRMIFSKYRKVTLHSTRSCMREVVQGTPATSTKWHKHEHCLSKWPQGYPSWTCTAWASGGEKQEAACWPFCLRTQNNLYCIILRIVGKRWCLAMAVLILEWKPSGTNDSPGCLRDSEYRFLERC